MSNLSDDPSTLPETADLHLGKAPNTVKAYRSDWATFEAFCRDRKLVSLPATPLTVVQYLDDTSRRLKTHTIERHLASISRAHQFAGVPNPVEAKFVRTIMATIRRVKGTAQQGKEPLSAALLRRMFAKLPDDLRGRRDRALLLIGFAGAFRRNELVQLRCEDIRVTEEGLIVTIPGSQTDRDGAGQTVTIPKGRFSASCPVRALNAWLEQSHITSGYLFPAIGRWGREVTAKAICDHQLAKIIKRLAAQAGLAPACFSGHSLRSGLATAAVRGGASGRAIMDQTRYRSLNQVGKYIRRGSLFQDNAAARSGL